MYSIKSFTLTICMLVLLVTVMAPSIKAGPAAYAACCTACAAVFLGNIFLTYYEMLRNDP